MIPYMLPLFDAFFSSGFFSFWFVPLLCLAFLATVPVIIRYIVGCHK